MSPALILVPYPIACLFAKESLFAHTVYVCVRTHKRRTVDMSYGESYQLFFAIKVACKASAKDWDLTVPCTRQIVFTFTFCNMLFAQCL